MVSLNTHRAPTNRRGLKVALAGVVAAALAGGGIALAGTASASTPTPTAGNITVLSAGPRIVASPGSSLVANTPKSFKIAGGTFGGIVIPADATGAVLNVSAGNPSGAGKITVWTHGVGKPGTGQVSFAKGENANSVVFVGFDSDGLFDVQSNVNTNVNIAIQSYVTPVDGIPAPVIKDIAPSEKALEHVGPSVRTDNATPGSGVTDFGSVTLEAGTYDTRITGGFSGLKGAADIPAGTQLLGGVFLTKGAGITAGFGTVLGQAQGVAIPKTNSGSATYTIDPTIAYSGYLVLTTETEVHVSLYAYSSDGVDRAALGVKGNIASAQFRKL